MTHATNAIVRILVFLIMAFTVMGCAKRQSTSDVLAISYESPRPNGFGWNIMLLPDGLAMIQEYDDPIEYMRLDQKTTDSAFRLANRIAASRDSMVAVVGGRWGRMRVHSDADIVLAIWDEVVAPDYGFIALSTRPEFEAAQRFASNWVRFKILLAGAITASPRCEKPQHIDERSDQVLQAMEQRWNSLREFWAESMEQSYRFGRPPKDEPSCCDCCCTSE